jgi:hypothetical protein
MGNEFGNDTQNPVTLDFSQAQPVQQPAPAQSAQAQPVSLDFSKAQPVTAGDSSGQPTVKSPSDLAASSNSSADLEQKMSQQPTHIFNPVTKRIELHPNVAGNVLEGVKQSFVGQMAKDSIEPPQGAGEHIALFAGGGPQALVGYRQAKKIVDSVEAMMDPKKPGVFAQAMADYKRGDAEFRKGDYRNAASSLVSTLSDAGKIAMPVMAPAMSQTRELSEGARPGENLATPLTRQILDAGTALVGGEPAAKSAEGVVDATADAAANAANAGKNAVKNAPKNIAAKIEEVKPEQLTRRAETPAAQHGTPLTVESPLDGPTVGKQLGGKDLSAGALKKLQEHVGETIPAGSTAKNRLMASVEPVAKNISENVSKMNQLVKDANRFTTSVMQDNVFGEGSLTTDLDNMKKSLPASDRVKLSADVDDVLEDADEALNSNDPAHVLEQRRILGNKIDWDAIEKNPSTPAEVQNAARARVYKALTDKIHEEIPETVPVDKELQPNLELRSHQRSKLGTRVVDDPHAATAEAQSEFKKGQTTVENDLHNAVVEKNISRIKTILKAAGLFGIGTAFGEVAK